MAVCVIVPSTFFGQSKELDSLSRVLTQSTNDTTKISVWLRMHDILKLSEFRQAALYADSAFALAQKLDWPKGLAQSGQFHGVALSLTSKFEEAKEVLNITIENSKLIGDKNIEAYAYLTLGNVEYDLSNYAQALPNYQNSKRIYLEANNYAGASSALIWMGIVNQNAMGNFPRAIEIYKEAAEFAEKGKSTLNKSYIFNNLGNIYYQLNEYDSAIHYTKVSNDIKRKFSDKRGLSNGLELLANCYVDQGQYETSLQFYEESLSLRKDLGDSIGLSGSYINMGRVYGLSGNLSKALEYISEGRNLAMRIGHEEVLPESYEYESDLLERSNRYKEALMSHKSFKAIDDSLFNRGSQKVLEELQIKYDTETKENQIEVQNARISQQNERLTRNGILITSLIIISALLVLVVFLVRNKQAKKQALIKRESELKLREAEINAVINSQEKERNRFARDLHDGFGQLISVLKLNLSQLNEVTNRDMEKRAEVFKNGESVINEMFTELRNICFDLMPQTLVKRGLTSALKEFGTRINQTEKVKCEVLVFDNNERLPSLVEISLFRITQEWVNNILKYADASVITIQITRESSEVTLTLEDNGVGFNSTDFFEGKGNGWRNIQTRLKQVSGTFDLDTTLGRNGTMVTINSPISAIENQRAGEALSSDSEEALTVS